MTSLNCGITLLIIAVALALGATTPAALGGGATWLVITGLVFDTGAT